MRLSAAKAVWALAILMLGFARSASGAAQDEPRLEVNANPARITVGDLVDFKIKVTGPVGSSVKFPPPGESLGPFEVRGFRVLDPSSEAGKAVFEAQLTLSIFQTGDFQIPSMDVVYQPPDGGPTTTLPTPETTVVVESVKTGDASDIRDIKPPLEIPRAWWTYWPWALLLAALAAAAYGLSRRRKQKPGAEPIRPLLSPYAEAYQALCRLRDDGLPDAGRIKTYHTELSEIMRRYLQRRFDVQALEMTTFEIHRELRGLGLDESLRGLFDQLLDRCDLVKFAKHVPTPGQIETCLKAAFQILEETGAETPVAVEKPAAGGVAE